MTRQDWTSHRGAERFVRGTPPQGRYALGLAYANSYHVGMSSLGFQRVWDLVHRRRGWRCERFFADGDGPPLSVESHTPLGAFAAVAFSVSFEEDYVNLLRMLRRSGIPWRRCERGPEHPLVIMGGSCAMINPLPLQEFVDVFALGAAENLLPDILAALEEEPSNEAVAARLAERPGFYVPSRHDPEGSDDLAKLEKLELSAEQMRMPGHLPSSAIVTPHTEFADKSLVEMSRGCPEKCRYCWATFGMGTFRWHPTELILEAAAEARATTDQIGFLATAVGDHPEVESILEEVCRMGFRASVSSIRIPAVSEGVLRALHESGDRSITLAPETGGDRLRALMGKPVTNAMLLEKIGMIFAAGFTQLKLYFIVGQPEESLEDVMEIAARQRMLVEARRTGTIGHIHLGVNVLIPKPYTPWQREPLADERSLRAKLRQLQREIARLPNVSMGPVSLRQAAWQAYISRAGGDAAEALEAMASGEPLSAVLRRFSEQIHPEIYRRHEGDLRWHFMRAASRDAYAALSPG
ncbi:MAG: radical SAM protein [Thermoanaerobaculia bacterium]|nr:radical SAM protein [Thermoanaerobaculia bacterium]